jgi:hypothetical protein
MAHPRPITSATVTGEKRVRRSGQPVRPTFNQPRRLNLLSCRDPAAGIFGLTAECQSPAWY